VPVKGLTKIKQIDFREAHACALRADGSVWCWGRNSHSQLGDGTNTDRNVPVMVPASKPL
jgi:alpha-tubulin suppressor-like RCC1 family protein